MQLIYLYVEEYKNIKNQGFNFSPRFSCSFDKEKSELKITENQNHIENFFGDNIEVTAIVGENGAGKSSIFKIIFMLIYFQKFCYSGKSPFYDEEVIKTLQCFVNKDLFIIVSIKNEKFKFSLKAIIQSLAEKHSDLEKYLPRNSPDLQTCPINDVAVLPQVEFTSFFIHFNYMLDTLYDSEADYWVKEIYHKADSYETPLLLEPYKNNNDGQIINLDIIEYLNNQNLLRFYSKLESSKKLFLFFNPNKIKFGYITRQYNWGALSDDDFEVLSNFRHLISYKFFNLLDEGTFISLQSVRLKRDGGYSPEIKAIGSWLENLHLNSKFLKITELYLIFKALESDRKLFKPEEYEKILEWADDLDSVAKFQSIPNVNYNVLIAPNAAKYEVRKIQICIDFLNSKLSEDKNFIELISRTKKVVISEAKEYLNVLPPWVAVGFYEDNKSLSSLSSGEKSFFTFFINLLYQVQNINDRSEYKELNIFLDEIELGFHPEWQKRFLNYLINTLSIVNKKKVNFFIATHSPFILSDIPNQNIVFLKGGKQVNAFDKKNTFGANIHTLLSDGFFMDGGLMGEFAKHKIEEVIKLLNGKSSEIKTTEEAQQIINIIGEPILKRELQRMLTAKQPDEVSKVKEQIKNLEQRLAELENAKD